MGTPSPPLWGMFVPPTTTFEPNTPSSISFIFSINWDAAATKSKEDCDEVFIGLGGSGPDRPGVSVLISDRNVAMADSSTKSIK